MSYNYSSVNSQEKFDIISNQIKSFETQHYRNSLSLMELNAVDTSDKMNIELLNDENMNIEKKIAVLKIELDLVSKLLPQV